ncbi:hypothetical protein [Raineyella sp.]|uniref:hypothetical protein n=1 Tax=Raineyella sp. TaxID=1911550 RepID=UPI002B1E92A4|nr:hypothetical protein [Raineyella sp.]MEA5154599.1 hypothetical protein [Raineyella sp.]
MSGAGVDGVGVDLAGRGCAATFGGPVLSGAAWVPRFGEIDLASIRARFGSAVDAVFALTLLVLMAISAVVISAVLVGVMAGYIS